MIELENRIWNGGQQNIELENSRILNGGKQNIERRKAEY
jgi:hypothetical protein